jgi:RNA polymerase sigma-70 factor (ECF subfamily)
MTAQLSFIGQQRFASLHNRLFPKLIGFLSAQIPRQEAEEIAQEALLKVYQRLQHEHSTNDHWSDNHLTALTYAIAKNLLISRMRHLKIRWQYHEQQRTELSMEQPCNAEQTMINDDMHRHLLTAINRLPAICRNVFILRQIHNKRYQDIASELNISIKTVENHLAKGMKLCRQYMIESANQASSQQRKGSPLCK